MKRRFSLSLVALVLAACASPFNTPPLADTPAAVPATVSTEAAPEPMPSRAIRWGVIRTVFISRRPGQLEYVVIWPSKGRRRTNHECLPKTRVQHVQIVQAVQCSPDPPERSAEEERDGDDKEKETQSWNIESTQTTPCVK